MKTLIRFTENVTDESPALMAANEHYYYKAFEVSNHRDAALEVKIVPTLKSNYQYAKSYYFKKL